MAYANAQKSRLLVGSLHASGYARSVSSAATTEMLDVTTLLDTARVFIPGQTDSTSDYEFLFDSDTSAGMPFAVWNTWKGTPQVVSYGPEGFTANTPVIMSLANLTSLTRSSAPSSPVGVQIASRSDGETAFGLSMKDLTAATANTSYTAVDNGASSASGGVTHIHVSAFSGFTNIDVRMQHSTDDSTYVDLFTDQVFTGVGSSRKLSTGTVNRYSRCRVVVSGSGSATFQVSFARL